MKKELLLIGLSLFSVTTSAQQIHSIISKKIWNRAQNIYQNKANQTSRNRKTKRVSENGGNTGEYQHRTP